MNSSNLRDREGEIYDEHCYGKLFGAKGYGFGGGGGVGLSSGKFEGADPLHGSAAIDAEIQKKLQSKYDEKLEGKVRAWLEEFLAEQFPEKTLQEALKSGVRLCKAANKVIPGAIKKINTGNFAAMQRENISAYIKFCNTLAFNKGHMFETADLFDGKNMVQVIENVRALHDKAVHKGVSKQHDIGNSAAPPPVEIASAVSYSPPAAGEPAAEPAAAEPAAEPAPAAGGGGGEVCPDCGAERGAGADFCADCGHKF